MIDDSRPADGRDARPDRAGGGPARPPSPEASGEARGELFESLFGGDDPRPAAKRPKGELPRRVVTGDRERGPDAAFEAPHVEAPRPPATPAAAGLTTPGIAELILKSLYVNDRQYGVEIAQGLRLGFAVIEAALSLLKDERLLEVPLGHPVGPASYQFRLTDVGRERARDAFRRCRYVGPAPVTLADYEKQARTQHVTGISCHRDELAAAFENLIIRDGLLDELGPAVCSGKSIFLYGPPGNGKSAVSKGLGRFLNTFGGEIYVPYAIEHEGALITMFDPTLHEPVESAGVGLGENNADRFEFAADAQADPRWRRVRRPVVITGGELTLDMLDLRYDAEANVHTAPLHIKANGGVFLIDDFGRQLVSPRDLLNRWILPLEERLDYLTPATGKKFSVPFEQLIIFSTNVDPKELADDAFLRRIRNKIEIGPPDRETFEQVFRLHCGLRGVPFEPSCVEFLYDRYYSRGRQPRASDARDLLEIVIATCRYMNQPSTLSVGLIDQASRRFFVSL
ncbi:MAG: ATPase [Planctomycetota bacterium]